MGSRSKPIRQTLEEAKRLGRNALSQVDGDPKDHEQNRQTDAAYPVSSFRESVQRTLCTLLCLFQLGCSCISGESGTMGSSHFSISPRAASCRCSGRRGRMRCSAISSLITPRSSMVHSTEQNTSLRISLRSSPVRKQRSISSSLSIRGCCKMKMR